MLFTLGLNLLQGFLWAAREWQPTTTSSVSVREKGDIVIPANEWKMIGALRGLNIKIIPKM